MTGERDFSRYDPRTGQWQSDIWLIDAGPDADIPLSEGFCPKDHTALAGDCGNWCPSCKTYWHLITAAEGNMTGCSGPSSAESSVSPASSPPSGSNLATSECDRAEVCRYDKRCSFYAEHCRLTEPK